ncbi:MAG: Holliday junction resolvase RuvX [Acidobacteriaceae bacterium]
MTDVVGLALHDTPDDTRWRWMGLDIGDRRIGVALSDPLGFAQPLLTLTRSNRRQDLRALARLARRHACVGIVVGNPLHMSGDLSPQAAKVHAFVDLLRAQTGVPIHLWDERLTTTEAHALLNASGRRARESRHVQKRIARERTVDQVAAVLILQGFLDAQSGTVTLLPPDSL